MDYPNLESRPSRPINYGVISNTLVAMFENGKEQRRKQGRNRQTIEFAYPFLSHKDKEALFTFFMEVTNVKAFYWTDPFSYRPDTYGKLVAVTTSSSAVTSSNDAFADIQVGDKIYFQYVEYEVASVVSANQIVLKTPYSGGSTISQPFYARRVKRYKVRFDMEGFQSTYKGHTPKGAYYEVSIKMIEVL